LGGGGIARLCRFHGEVVAHFLGKVLLEAVAVQEEPEFAKKVWYTIHRYTIQ
jgi:hypothetical protein